MAENRLKEIRKAKGFTAFQLAQASGVQPSLIFRYESGQHTPQLANARALAEALGVSLDELFPRDEVSA